MYVRVLIQSSPEEDRLAGSRCRLFYGDDVESAVCLFRAYPDGSFARQHVTLGYRTGDQYYIAEGLKAGDQIVVDGAIFVQFMQTQ